MTRHEQAFLEIIIPCFNEEEVIPLLLQRLHQFMTQSAMPVRVLFIDDGSKDETSALLKAACEHDHRLSLIRFSRNFGHQAAVSAGLDFSTGELVGVIDADLQDPPEVLLEMAEKWRQGYDVVYGIRRNRKENIILRGSYSLFYKILKKIAAVEIPLDAGDFCVMDRRVVDKINAMPEHHRFIRGLRGWVGFSQLGLPYERQARQAGEPKYNLIKLFKLALDGLITFSSLPLRLSSWVGAFSALFGLLYIVYAIWQKLVFGNTPSGWTSMVVLFLFFGGIQLLVLGIMGEYIGRIFDEVKNRPHYIVSETSNIRSDIK